MTTLATVRLGTGVADEIAALFDNVRSEEHTSELQSH